MPESSMEAPEQIVAQSLGDYLDVMSKVVFQSGMSWKVIEAKWPSTREAFQGFDIDKVAEMTEDDIDALASDTRVIRNRRKLAAVVGNAQRMIELEQEHGTFQNYLRSQDSFAATIKTMRKDFKFVGEMGCYYFLYVVGEEVPPHEEVMKK
jgi:3-methyladenine DNA glycosylase Tag